MKSSEYNELLKMFDDAIMNSENIFVTRFEKLIKEVKMDTYILTYCAFTNLDSIILDEALGSVICGRFDVKEAAEFYKIDLDVMKSIWNYYERLYVPAPKVEKFEYEPYVPPPARKRKKKPKKSKKRE